MPTIGLFNMIDPVEPKKGGSARPVGKLKMPPSEATR